MLEELYNELGIEIYWRFTGAAIEAAPEEPGVFAFFDEAGGLLLMGSTVRSLRTTFQSHWKGYEGRITCGAAFIGFEVAKQPLETEAELAAMYEQRFGRVPRRQAG